MSTMRTIPKIRNRKL